MGAPVAGAGASGGDFSRTEKKDRVRPLIGGIKSLLRSRRFASLLPARDHKSTSLLILCERVRLLCSKKSPPEASDLPACDNGSALAFPVDEQGYSLAHSKAQLFKQIWRAEHGDGRHRLTQAIARETDHVENACGLNHQCAQFSHPRIFAKGQERPRRHIGRPGLFSLGSPWVVQT